MMRKILLTVLILIICSYHATLYSKNIGFVLINTNPIFLLNFYKLFIICQKVYQKLKFFLQVLYEHEVDYLLYP